MYAGHEGGAIVVRHPVTYMFVETFEKCSCDANICIRNVLLTYIFVNHIFMLHTYLKCLCIYCIGHVLGPKRKFVLFSRLANECC